MKVPLNGTLWEILYNSNLQWSHKGCTACHTGIALGGTMQPFQVAQQYKFTNVGDFKGDKNGMVKTPTLRNITETAPYFHNGQIWSLNEAVKEMGSVQLGINITDADAAKTQIIP